MIIELVYSRGLGLYIDGATPSVKNWGFGGEGLSLSFTNPLSFDMHDIDVDEDRGWQTVSGLDIEIGHSERYPNEWWCDGDGNDHDGLPQRLRLKTDRGIITANVTDIVIGGQPFPDPFGLEAPLEELEPEPEPNPESIAAGMDSGDEYGGLEDADEFAEHGGYTVHLANGTTRGIDGYMAYIKAETYDV
jgi:hypothetical protein